LLYAGYRLVPAHNVDVLRPRELAGSDCSGSAIVTSNQTVLGTCQLIRNDNQISSVYSGFNRGNRTLIYPDFTDTTDLDSWRSLIVIQNPSMWPANLNIKIGSRSGGLLYSGSRMIPAHGVGALRPRDLVGSDCSGSIGVASNQTIVGVCQMTSNNNIAGNEYPALDHGSLTLYYPDFTDTTDSNNWRSWVIVKNPTTSTANIDLDIRSRTGVMLYSGNSAIPAKAVYAFRPKDLVGSDCSGSAVITSDQPIAGTCQMTSNINKLTIGYNALDHGNTMLLYPDFTDTNNPEGWRSSLVLQNPTAEAANITLELRSKTANQLYSGSMTIPAYSVSAIRPMTLAGTDCSGSAVITSDQPITGICQISRNDGHMCMSYPAFE